MAKAITYNLDKNGQKKGAMDRNTSDLFGKNEFITFHSSKYQESELFSDNNDAPTDTANLSSYVINVNAHSKRVRLLRG